MVMLVVAFVLVVLGLGTVLFLGRIIKKGVETAGPKVAKVEIKLNRATVSLLSGRGALKGLVVGNPTGFKTPYAIKVGRASVALRPSSIFADKIVVQSVDVQSPEITFEGSLKGNNLGKIKENIQQFTAAEKSAPAEPKKEAGKKMQIDDLAVTGGKIHLSMTVLGGKSLSVPLPDIHLTGLGKDTGGITAGEMVEKLFGSIFDNTLKAVTDALGKVGKEAAEAAKDVGKAAARQAEKATKRIGDLLKKK